MYADTPQKLEAAIEELQAKSHQGYVQRVNSFLERKKEWVLLFRRDLTTRGHNTNNFAEACIRVLKDIVLQRRKAYNVVALVDFIISVWEDYFRRRLLTHAHNRKPIHALQYDRLLRRMPASAAQAVTMLDDNVYQVPSGQEDEKVYEVNCDVGMCTCAAGQQGAFCKHQALVHQRFGGPFPNAPVLSAHDRHQLGLLALGPKCQPAAFFQGFQDASQEPSTSSATEATAAPAQEDIGPLVDYEQPASLDNSPPINEQEHRQVGIRVIKIQTQSRLIIRKLSKNIFVHKTYYLIKDTNTMKTHT